MWIVIGLLLTGLGVWMVLSHDARMHVRYGFLIPGILAAGIMMVLNGMMNHGAVTYWLDGSVVLTAIVAVVFALVIYMLLRKITHTFRLNHPVPRDREKSF